MNPDLIYALDEAQLAKVLAAGIDRLGQLGHDGRLALQGELESGSYNDAEEGIAHIEELFN